MRKVRKITHCIALSVLHCSAIEYVPQAVTASKLYCRSLFRYTNLVDRYIPNIARGLRDEESLIRRQTLTLLTHLLQVDYDLSQMRYTIIKLIFRYFSGCCNNYELFCLHQLNLLKSIFDWYIVITELMLSAGENWHNKSY